MLLSCLVGWVRGFFGGRCLCLYKMAAWREIRGRFKVVLAVISALSRSFGWQDMFSRTFPIVGGCSRFRSLV